MVNHNSSNPQNKNPARNVQHGRTEKNSILSQIIGIGVVAGMRTTFAPAVLSHYFNRNPGSVTGSAFGFMASPITSIITKLMAIGEITGDKLPSTPDRTGVPQIFGRIASGALAGVVISKANNQDMVKGFLIGGISALAGTFGAFYLRKYIDTIPNVNDVFVGLGEDVVALTTGVLLLNES
jgi:uncharacterized membrane protein